MDLIKWKRIIGSETGHCTILTSFAGAKQPFPKVGYILSSSCHRIRMHPLIRWPVFICNEGHEILMSVLFVTSGLANVAYSVDLPCGLHTSVNVPAWFCLTKNMGNFLVHLVSDQVNCSKAYLEGWWLRTERRSDAQVLRYTGELINAYDTHSPGKNMKSR